MFHGDKKMKDGRWEGEKLRSPKMRLKASKPCVSANSHELSGNRHFDAFAADTIHLKKPSVGPKGLMGPPCHGALGRRRQQKSNNWFSIQVAVGVVTGML